jgi:hypothetical protein
MHYHRCPEDPPDVTMQLEEFLVPGILHQAMAYFRTGQTAAGKKYQDTGNQINNAQYGNDPDCHQCTHRFFLPITLLNNDFAGYIWTDRVILIIAASCIKGVAIGAVSSLT